VANGTIDVLPEVFGNIAAWLPRTVTVVSANPYGGAMRVEIQGDGVELGAVYQIVITEEPMKRTIELVKNAVMPVADGPLP
jgi:hypothetical protein